MVPFHLASLNANQKQSGMLRNSEVTSIRLSISVIPPVGFFRESITTVFFIIYNGRLGIALRSASCGFQPRRCWLACYTAPGSRTATRQHRSGHCLSEHLCHQPEGNHTGFFRWRSGGKSTKTCFSEVVPLKHRSISRMSPFKGFSEVPLQHRLISRMSLQWTSGPS